MATFASATDFTADSAPDTMLAAVDNAKGAPAVRMDVVRRNLRRLQTREFMSQWNTQKTADAIPIRAHGEHRTCNNQQPTSNIEHRTSWGAQPARLHWSAPSPTSPSVRRGRRTQLAGAIALISWEK